MFEDILIPTDGSECAHAAVGYAQDLATRYDATVHSLSVADSRVLENAPHHDQVTDERAEIAERTCNDLSADGLSVEHVVRTGVPHEAILRYTEEAGIDLVVMGTHGRTGVDRLLLGSVTEKVLRLSNVPVLPVPEPAMTCASKSCVSIAGSSFGSSYM
jgi:nucleotide-binding universal stress UspA family protein